MGIWQNRKQKNYKRRWFSLGTEYGAGSQYDFYAEYKKYLARDNLNMMKGYCSVSYPLMLMIIALTCTAIGWKVIYILPFVAGTAVIAVLHILLARGVGKSNPVKTAYLMVTIFNVVWYALVILYEAILQPHEPTIRGCLVFVLLAAIFNTLPLANMLGSMLAYVVFMGSELVFADAAVIRMDSLNILLSIMAGVYISWRNTESNISRKVYTDMYKAATQTSIIVAQVDLLHGTYEVLQSPDYMVDVLQTNLTADVALQRIRDNFVAPEYRDEFSKIFDFETLPDRLDLEERVSFYFQDFREMWCQLVVVEEKRIRGKVSAVVAIVRDVDMEKRREMEYQKQLSDAVEEAKLASASKTNFLRRMSHDIRTPINGIQGMLEIAEHYSDDMEKQRECRAKMKEASGYLLSLVNDVLDMNKLESGIITLEDRPFNLMELLGESNTVAEMQAIDHGISYVIDWDNSHIDHIFLIGSPVHLKQILHNFASNAVKYNKENGTVTVSSQELSFDGENAVFRFVCADTGIGMSREFMQHAFEPFSQEGRDSRTTYAGTGLGLSIVKELAERMGGHVDVTSEPGVGSTFSVTLPFKVDTNAENTAKNGILESIDTKGMRALVVEDNALNMEIAQFMLESEGFVVYGAENGQEAVDMFAESEPGYYDIVFMDIMMPVMGGREAARTIRSMDRADAKIIPIVAMSANAFSDDVQGSIAAGMNAHIMKPIDSSKLKNTTQDVLRMSSMKKMTELEK